VRGLRQGAAENRALSNNREEKLMSKSKSTKKAAAPKAKKVAKVVAEVQELPKKEPRENLCVFAFRLTEAERDSIHKAAGPAKASKFVRTLAVAAARNDEDAVKATMKGISVDA
jgi:hypothetical protein